MERACNHCGWEFYEPIMFNGRECCPECETGFLEGEEPDIEFKLTGKEDGSC